MRKRRKERKVEKGSGKRDTGRDERKRRQETVQIDQPTRMGGGQSERGLEGSQCAKGELQTYREKGGRFETPRVGLGVS
jgi:hypothetical protein